MLGSDIVTRVRYVLNDAAGTRWTDAELALWINDGCGFIGINRPDSCAVNASMTLAAGAKQSIAGLSPAGFRLLDVMRDVATGGPITITDRQVLDAFKPGWYAATAGTVKHYVYDERDPTTFYVYPPAVSNAAIEILYARLPAETTAGNLGSTTLTPGDIYRDALLNYVLFRSYAKDSDETHNAELARLYLDACANSLGLKSKGDLKASPDMNSPGGKPPPSIGV